VSERCVVTGGTGVIGQCLVDLLVDRGSNVRVIDLLPPSPDLNETVDYVQGDLVDVGARAIADFDPTTVYHLAAAFERSDESPEFWRENAHHNVEVSRCVLEGATASGRLRRYVFASSYLIYHPDLYLSAEPPAIPVVLNEESPIAPRNVTGAAKLLHENEIVLAAEDARLDFSAVSARIYRVYGRSSRDVVSRWIRDALTGGEIDVFGAESLFDYVFADDVAEGLLRLGDSDVEGVVNLASGRSRRVQEVVDCIQTHVPTLKVNGPHPAEVYEASQASLYRLETATGWSPQTSLERGISELIRHERSNLDNQTVSRRVRPPRSANVLISSLSRKAGIVRAVRGAYASLNLIGSVWGTDTDPLAPARSIVDKFWHSPPLSDLTDEDFIEACELREIRLVVPTRDGELERFAHLRERLAAAGTFVAVGSSESIVLSTDKLRFAEFCSANGHPVVPTSDEIRPEFGECLAVKPRRSAGSIDLALDVSREQAVRLIQSRDDMVVQPMISGTEYSIDVYVRGDGEPLGAVVRRRTRVAAGEAVISSTVERADIREIAISCALALGVRGHAVLQVLDTDSGPLLLECNARVGGASAASWAAGLRSVDALLLEALGETPGPFRLGSMQLTMTRLPIDSYRWE